MFRFLKCEARCIRQSAREPHLTTTGAFVGRAIEDRFHKLHGFLAASASKAAILIFPCLGSVSVCAAFCILIIGGYVIIAANGAALDCTRIPRAFFGRL